MRLSHRDVPDISTYRTDYMVSRDKVSLTESSLKACMKVTAEEWDGKRISYKATRFIPYNTHGKTEFQVTGLITCGI